MCLFENYKNQTKKLKKIVNFYEKKEMLNFGLSYDDCKMFLIEVEKIGFTFDYGLDAQPFNLRKKI